MEYQACLDYLHTHCQRGTPGGYQRTVRMAELLGNPQEQLQVIHIAGTNGKGSTAAVIAAVLQQAGYRVGLFTSPHLVRYEERLQINGQPIAESIFARIMTRLITEIIPVLLREALGHPGEFELLTVAGWLYFQNATDFVVLEVGLGGTLDPTNIIQKPLLCVITPVSLDHCQILGDTVEQIAREKAGILKSKVPAVIAPQEPAATQAIAQIALQKQVPLTQLRQEQLQPIETVLQGAYQQINCNTALAAINNLMERDLIAVTRQQIAQALQQVTWPGRMEYIDLNDGKGILLDGAHNPAGMACLAQNLRMLYSDRRIVLFLSILDDKAQSAMLEQILPVVQQVVLTKPDHDQRAQHWQQLQQEIARLAPQCPCQVYDAFQEGLVQTMQGMQSGDLLCITGSLYLLGDCRHFLQTVLS